MIPDRWSRSLWLLCDSLIGEELGKGGRPVRRCLQLSRRNDGGLATMIAVEVEKRSKKFKRYFGDVK